MDFQNRVEFFIISFIAAICIIIPVLDFIGAIDSIPWLSQRITTMTLLSIGAVALYLVSQHHRRFRELTDAIQGNTNKILNKIAVDETSQKIIHTLNEIWDERENDFEQIFANAAEIAVSNENDTLKKFLKECEDDLDKGEIFGTKFWRPWDVNLIAVDFTGKIFYHTHEKALFKRYRKDHPTWEILKRRNGTLFWLNSERGKLAFALNIPYRRNMRFTKIHFREIPHLKAIIIIQSHINIVPYVVKSYSEASKSEPTTSP